MNRRFPAPLLILLGATTILGGCSRTHDPVVGQTLERQVRASEFRERYMKYLSTSGARDNVILREKILNNMLNETLILHDLRARGLDDDRTCRDKMDQIGEQALLDGYAKRVSTDTMTVSEEELEREFRAYNSKVAVRYVYGKTEEEALALKHRLEDGETFERLARETFEDPDLARNGGYTGFFAYGDMDWEFEDAAFSLPPGRLSDPVKFRAGYAIVRVENRVQLPLASEVDFAKQKQKLEGTIRRKKALRLVKAEADRVADKLQPAFDSTSVALIHEHWAEINSIPADVPGSGNPPWHTDALSGRPLVRCAGSQWTIGDFVRNLRHTTARQRNAVKTEKDVRDIAVGLASRDVLLAKARAEGLESDPVVKEQQDRLREEWLLRRWQTIAQDSVNDTVIDPQELQHHFEENRVLYAVPPMINVAEILVRSKPAADSLARLLRHGADFGKLAGENSIRTQTAKQGGEVGFQPPRTFGQYSKKFTEARPGEIIGPLSVDSYSGIYRILGKQAGRPMTFDEARPLILMELLPPRKAEAFRVAVEKLRTKHGVTVDMQSLANIDVSPT